MERGGPVQVMPGRKKDSIIFHCGDGFYYLARETRKSRVRLACRHYNSRGGGCEGTASLSLVTGYLKHGQMHNHGADRLFEAEQEARKAVILKAEQSNFGEKVQAILRSAKISMSDPLLACRFTRVRMTSALYRAKSSMYPPIPKTLLTLGVLIGFPNMHEVCRTVDGKDYLFQGVVGDANSKTVAIVFVSGRMLHFLQGRNSIHADGTFKKRPRKPRCRQIFNIVVNYNGVVIGVVRIIMRSRKQEAYVTVLLFLKSIAPNWNPALVHCDFERAEINGFRIVFPLCRIVGCLWHFGVRVADRARKIGLTSIAHSNALVFSFIRSLCAVPLLPQYLMWTGVRELWLEVEASGWGPQLLPLFQYFELEWQPRSAELCVFGLQERTNNVSESDNHMLRNVFPQDHPNVYAVLGGFVQMEHLAWCDVVAISELRPVVPARRIRSVLNDRKVRMAQQLLINKDLTPGAFLQQISVVNHAAAVHGLHLRSDSDSEDSDTDCNY